MDPPRRDATPSSPRARGARRWRWPWPTRPELAVHVVHDERVAGFVALGLGLGGVPAVVLCTSGTAAANLHPAVVEAGLSAVPMLVLTADRPPELRDVGAAQTIDQTHLFGRSVRWFHDPGVPDPAAAGELALAGPPGPRGRRRRPGPPQPAVPGAARRHARARCRAAAEGPPAARFATMGLGVPGPELAALDHQRGVILAGGRSGVPADVVAALADATSWPVLADPTSGMTGLPGAVTCADALLRHARFAADHTPGLVVRVGRPAASKVLGQWVAGSGAPVVQVGGPGVVDPDHRVTVALDAEDLAALAETWKGASGTPWAARWRAAAQAAEAAIDAALAEQTTLTEPAVARTVARHLPASTPSSSSPRRCPCATSSGSAGQAPAPTPTGAPTASTASSRPRSASPSGAARSSRSSATSPSSTTPAR